MKIVYGTIAQATTEPYSQLDALARIRQINKELDQCGPWPENITSWLLEHHQMKLQSIRNIGQACLNQDGTGLNRVLSEYKTSWLIGLYLWRKHHQ